MTIPTPRGASGLRPRVTDYSVAGYGAMIDDAVRVDAYRSALRRVVSDESVVLDLGAGTGIFSLLACQFGARKVYAVEPGESIHVARRLATDNGFADRIVFIQDVSSRISFDERADVVISDLRGRLPLFERHIDTIVDVRRRLLRPGGVQISQQDVIWVSLVDSPEMYESTVARTNRDRFGFDFRHLREMASNAFHGRRVESAQLATEPKPWTRLDYRTITSSDAAGEIGWEIDRARTLHGFAMWFHAVVFDDITFSNAPGGTGAIHGQTFFPWSRPVDLAAGDRVRVKLDAKLIHDDYVWRWRTEITDRSGGIREAFDQSTFKLLFGSMDRLRRRTEEHRPGLNEDGRVQLELLQGLRDGEALGPLAERLQERFPGYFRGPRAAFTAVADAAEAYGDDGG